MPHRASPRHIAPASACARIIGIDPNHRLGRAAPVWEGQTGSRRHSLLSRVSAAGGPQHQASAPVAGGGVAGVCAGIRPTPKPQENRGTATRKATLGIRFLISPITNFFSKYLHDSYLALPRCPHLSQSKYSASCPALRRVENHFIHRSCRRRL